MADNTRLSAGTNDGDTFRTYEDTNSVKWPAGVTAFLTTEGTPDVVVPVLPTQGLPVRLADGSGYITTLAVSLASVPSHAVTNAGTFAVQVDGSALTSLQLIDDVVYAEDAAHSSGDKGVAILVRRADTASSSGGTDGDYVTLNTDSTGRLWCNVSNTLAVGSHDVTNAGTFAVQAAQSGTWTVDLGATDNAVLDAIAASVAGTLTVGSHAVTNAGTFAVQAAQSGTWNITDVSGTVSLPTGAATAAKQPALGTAGSASADVITVQGIASMTAIKVDGSAVTQPVSGTVAVTNASLTTLAGAVYAEDAASANADPGVMVLARRTASPANTSGTDGDYEALQVSAGRLWTSSTIDAALPAGTNAIGKLAANSGVTIGAVEIAAAQTLATVTTVTTCSTLTGGGVAHDGADSGNPVKVGAKCSLTLSDDTIVANGDRTDATSDGDGALLVRECFPLGDLLSERVSNTDGNSTSFTNFAATASTRNYVTGAHVFRTDAGTSTAYVDFRDGTAGSVLYTLALPPNGGAVLPNTGVPWFRTTANTALAYDVSSALTTVYISITGFKSKV